MIRSRNFTSTVLRQKLFAALLFYVSGCWRDSPRFCIIMTSISRRASRLRLLPMVPFPHKSRNSCVRHVSILFPRSCIHPTLTIPSTCSLPHCQPRSSFLFLTSFSHFPPSIGFTHSAARLQQRTPCRSIESPRIKRESFSCRPTF